LLFAGASVNGRTCRKLGAHRTGLVPVTANRVGKLGFAGIALVQVVIGGVQQLGGGVVQAGSGPPEAGGDR